MGDPVFSFFCPRKEVMDCKEEIWGSNSQTIREDGWVEKRWRQSVYQPYPKEVKGGRTMVRIITALLITTALSVTFGSVAEPVMAKQLKPGMPNTIELLNGEVVYDLNGEWDAVYELTITRSWPAGGRKESSKDIVRITQEGSQFVGIKLIGDAWVGKNKKAVKGELEKNGFRKVHAVAYDQKIMRAIWVPSKGEISEDGNKIVIKTRQYGALGYYVTIALKRK